MKKGLYILIGILSLILAIVGVFLPILPTTPFLLLSSWLFLRSSDRLYNWLINHPVLGSYILDFQKNKAIPLRVKIVSVSLLWITISLSAFLFVNLWWIRILLFVIAIAVTLHILHYKTKK